MGSRHPRMHENCQRPQGYKLRGWQAPPRAGSGRLAVMAVLLSLCRATCGAPNCIDYLQSALDRPTCAAACRYRCRQAAAACRSLQTAAPQQRKTARQGALRDVPSFQ